MSAYELNLLAFKRVGKYLVLTDDEISYEHLPDLSHKVLSSS